MQKGKAEKKSEKKKAYRRPTLTKRQRLVEVTEGIVQRVATA